MHLTSTSDYKSKKADFEAVIVSSANFGLEPGRNMYHNAQQEDKTVCQPVVWVPGGMFTIKRREISVGTTILTGFEVTMKPVHS